MADWPGDTDREIHPEIDSTNAEALRRAAQGPARPVWILARRQTAGRGRRGRAWTQGGGNFAASLLLWPEGPASAAAQRSFAAALGLYDALVDATGRPELFALKWPNDVLLSGRKLAGILLETGGPARGPLGLAIGIGVNLTGVPEVSELDSRAMAPISLIDGAGIALTPEEFLDLLAPAIDHWEKRLAAEGFAPLRAAWLARAAKLGEVISARLPGREVTGLFETIDETGALVLATAEGRVTLPAAEVFFGAPAPAGAL